MKWLNVAIVAGGIFLLVSCKPNNIRDNLIERKSEIAKWEWYMYYLHYLIKDSESVSKLLSYNISYDTVRMKNITKFRYDTPSFIMSAAHGKFDFLASIAITDSLKLAYRQEDDAFTIYYGEKTDSFPSNYGMHPSKGLPEFENYLKRLLNQNRNKLSPWLRNEAEKRGYLGK